MMNKFLGGFALVVVTIVGAESVFAQAVEPPVTLRIHGPRSGDTGVMVTTGWSFKISLDVENAVAFAWNPEARPSQALIYDDPDGCLDMRDFNGSVPEPLERFCGSTMQDESFILFHPDRDDPGVTELGFDVATRCGHLVDSDASVANLAESTKQMLNLGLPFGSDTMTEQLTDVGPRTGPFRIDPSVPDTTYDCYGYGADDDIPGLVIMADIGAARVTDFEGNDTGSVRRIRNMAGLVSEVGYEYLDKKGRSAITATITVTRGMFETINVFDTDVSDPAVDFMMKIDDAAPVPMNYVGTPTSLADTARELVGATPLVDEKARFVLVDGVAPNFIDDLNEDGKFTVADLELMGYTPLSNQKRLRIIAKSTDAADTTDSAAFCASEAAVVTKDLDGSGDYGYQCTTGGSRGGRRIFR